MKRATILAAAVILVSQAAYAQQQQPQVPFAPYTVTEEQQKNLFNYLGDLPAKYANPLYQTFGQWEQQAQLAEARKVADEAKRAAEAKKPKEPVKLPQPKHEPQN